jgi:hypothetical protein
MIACTTTMGGFLTAGAARLGAACAVPAAHPGTLAPTHAVPTYVHAHVQGWQPIGGSETKTKPVSTEMFSTDRPHPRPPERSP